jgi:arylsulfatase A-like enzyme
MQVPAPSTKALVACLALAAFVSCATPDDQVQRPAPTANVILISIDTLRPDHLGCYGYDVPTSPSLDQFCAEAVVFEQAIAQAPSTLHSHASIFSSLLPHHHGASWGAKTRLPDEAVTITEVLKAAGYATGAFTGGGQMDRVFGLDQGFDVYDRPGPQRFLHTVRRGIEWLDTTTDRPFFLFLHSYEVHHPYEPSPEHLALVGGDYDGELPDAISIELLREYNSRSRELKAGDLPHIIATYDAEIRSMDEGFAFLVAALKERGLYDDTLIVFTSDHGEEFGEHGAIGWHSHSLYDELLRVPLVIRFPGGAHAGRVVEQQVRSLDIAPTMAAILGLPVPDDFAGVDLTRFITGDETLSLLAISRMDRKRGIERSSIRTDRWKMMTPGILYDLQTDPGEQWDTPSFKPTGSRDTVKRLQEALSEALAEREPLESEQVAPSESTLDELRALGYIN